MFLIKSFKLHLSTCPFCTKENCFIKLHTNGPIARLKLKLRTRNLFSQNLRRAVLYLLTFALFYRTTVMAQLHVRIIKIIPKWLLQFKHTRMNGSDNQENYSIHVCFIWHAHKLGVVIVSYYTVWYWHSIQN